MIRTGIVGVSGYSGLELLRLLSRHREAAITYLANRSGAVPNLPWLGRVMPQVSPFDLEACVEKCDLVFVALPSGSSGEIAKSLWMAGLHVIDLSGDLRLPRESYEQWYGRPALSHEVTEHAEYGLTEWRRNQIAKTNLIANPGCFATAAALSLLPLTSGAFVREDVPIVIDAKSGITGAGRTPTERTSLSELHQNFYAYKLGIHQHTPEIEQTIDFKAKVVLTAQVLPVPRGIYTCSYVQLKESCDVTEAMQAFACYENEPFVRVLPEDQIPDLIFTRGTNECHISLAYHERTHTLQVISALDNLLKGAAGQAVQNMNVLFGLEETTGLTLAPIYP